ncbi:sulfurtransferase [Polaribacter sp.]|uniref:sulfurtransferase n=1 Tax=Polaribacter sp. TaxID=1920175 RepID=UPI003F6C7F57
MQLIINAPLVSVDWLNNHLENKNLIVLNCTIPKVTASTSHKSDVKKEQIKGAIFFDLKQTFSDTDATFPNTVLSPEDFQEKAQDLGINNNSAIVCYDDLGIYSSPRVWWMFQLMGFTNITVLNGGFPTWKSKNYPVEVAQKHQLKKGDFTAFYQPKKIKFTKDVFNAIEDEETLIIDARSKGRFLATEPEPRKDLKGGHIPNSISLSFVDILDNGKMKSTSYLQKIFSNYNNKENLIFTCGSGITASILALGADLAGVKNYAVYDGSWTEWASTYNLPIEK